MRGFLWTTGGTHSQWKKPTENLCKFISSNLFQMETLLSPLYSFLQYMKSVLTKGWHFIYLFIYFLLKDNFVVFCQTSTWISHRYTYVPSLLNLPPISLPMPPLKVDTEPFFEFPEPYNKFPFAMYFAYGNVKFLGSYSWKHESSPVYPVEPPSVGL